MKKILLLTLGAIIALMTPSGAFTADQSFDTVTAKHLVINGGKTKAITIKPTAENEYAPVAWTDQKGNIVAMIVAHEKQTDGAVHNSNPYFFI